MIVIAQTRSASCIAIALLLLFRYPVRCSGECGVANAPFELTGD